MLILLYKIYSYIFSGTIKKASPSVQLHTRKFFSKRWQYLRHLQAFLTCIFYVVSDGKNLCMMNWKRSGKYALEVNEISA